MAQSGRGLLTCLGRFPGRRLRVLTAGPARMGGGDRRERDVRARRVCCVCCGGSQPYFDVGSDCVGGAGT